MTNSFGTRFSFTTFGESHGRAVGCIVDGTPAGVKISVNDIQKELNKRKPGGRYSTPRKEDDKVEILSGVFFENSDDEYGITTGTPISLVIFNQNQKSKDYSEIKDIFRPGHADFTYLNKYGVRDYKGGGRSSARETAARVAAGAVAKKVLEELNIEVLSGIKSVGKLEATTHDFEYAKTSEIYSLDKNIEEEQKNLIKKTQADKDSIGGSTLVKIKNAPIGLGEPIYYKLDNILASAMMSINAVKAVEIGNGELSSRLKGSVNNDGITPKGFITNNSGGILGGISNGEDIDVTIYFKPTPSIFLPQKSINTNNEPVDLNIKGRHDPCVAIRGSIVCEAMARVVVLDMMLMNMGRRIEDFKKVYN
ncbi:MAG: Chorismate synthase (EC [uncultured Campylobacterales bacterium]|uniref:Chorismate synthase n=1 Tax=uncultured Campylobacterales bacterium TaxID=352960 RepID=A0A6S6SZ30_9BACT|nr:MAG: Chorismate synthase (EC [uncultured Campylobacterales bacterium]